MSFEDPFAGYSALLRTIVYGVVPLFTVWQVARLRRALHVFQLEGYKRPRFLAWCRADRRRALFLRRDTRKKPLVMTGRAWRLLIGATILSVAVVLVPAGLVHVWEGWPYDIPTWAVTTAVAFLGPPYLLAASDVLLSPLQSAINGRFVRAARSRLDEVRPVVISITGSFGKTSTKFAVAGIIAEGAALATPGSYNTPLGVSRTINELLTERYRFFVVEMGAYREGEIAELCSFVRPKVGVLTAIGPAHLERFGSLDAIRRAKYEIVASLPGDGIAVMNVDDPEVRPLADETERTRVVRYGMDGDAGPDVTARGIEHTVQGARFEIVLTSSGESIGVQTRLLGRHAIGHVLAGVAVATGLGSSLRELEARIEALAPVEHRLEILEGAGGVIVIDDAYNSNPEGAEAALEVLESMPGARKVVVTPGIIEFGELQQRVNENLGEHAGRVADFVVVVARVNRDALVNGARRAGGAEVIAVGTLEEARAKLAQLLRPGDVVLFENDLPDHYEG
ncbi:MAG: UDP-N-acetylmuramoyl-tripeptide--D-alanyl-D-alanine ligase [Actinomycetota bacterium]